MEYLPAFKGNTYYGIVAACFIVLVTLISTIYVGKRKTKRRGVEVQVSGEPGYAVRNAQTTELLEVPSEGATTMAALFEQSCKKHSQLQCLGTRKVISKEFVEDGRGRKFEKLHLGEYQWETYGEIYNHACNFASGLVKLGHDVSTRAAIFSESRPEWLISLQVAICCVFLFMIFVRG